METFKIHSFSVLGSVFLSYLFSNKFLCALHELQPIPQHPALLGEQLWALGLALTCTKAQPNI